MHFRVPFAAQCDISPGARRRCKLSLITFVVALFALPLAALAQTPPDNGAPSGGFVSPIVPPPTATEVPSPTPTETATATPTFTPTPDLSTAVLQVSPLGIVPDDRPMDSAGPLPWLMLAALVVVAGAAVMVVAQRRK
ncbi:MAG: hypothetical protein M9936_22100 [Caldilinea sp.]|nr:hypothetical protein [Caldilinea sp.]MCB0066430.1 hypothetical protein [Caldilineaceae bacterium]MCB9115321.1 hypothetical protein [Caldilineaceae bacterium]MCO5212398.1 hypothetical protein [Caldilinea sp.]MCW5842244.1 hypothetical protein [Caldilinea sp.]